MCDVGVARGVQVPGAALYDMPHRWQATVINMTNHAYWNLSGDFKSDICDHVWVLDVINHPERSHMPCAGGCPLCCRNCAWTALGISPCPTPRYGRTFHGWTCELRLLLTCNGA